MASQIPLGWVKQPDGSYSSPSKLSTADLLKLNPPKEYNKMDLSAVIKPITEESKLNKLETAFLSVLRSRNYRWVGIQCWTLKLGFDTRYTPDFTAVDRNGHFLAFETKGFMRDDAFCKLKIASRMYSMMEFYLVTKDKSGWNEVIVRP